MFKKILLSCLILSFVVGGVISTGHHQAAATSVIVQPGDEDGYVWDVQHRLQQLGIYEEEMTGQYGSQTEESVQQFQEEHGLNVTGAVDRETLNVLHEVTLMEEEIEVLAKLVYGEARGEPFKGQVAVAAVVLNRLQSADFPDTVPGVAFESLAFTAVADGQYFKTPDTDAYRAVYQALQGWDPSEGALYYFNPVTATSDWIWTRPQIKQIGKHIFAE